MRNPFGQGSPFDEFFEQFGPNLGQRPQKPRKQRSLGSGVIISADGFIVTNNHVVENATKVTVNLQKDLKSYPAKVIGADPETDLALIKIEAGKSLPFLPLGDSSKAQVGEWVLAIGNPFGLDHTVTAGIISAKGRVIGEGPYDDFIQTDASINPGNSGGPLVNMNGEVIAINAAIVATGQGIGFAIPSDTAKEVIAQLQKTGKVSRGLVGVNIQDVDDNTAKALGLKEAKGALVASVVQGEAAEKAGIQAGDVITSVNGKPVMDSHELTRTIGSMPPGAKVDLSVWRKGQTKQIQLTLGERKAKKAGEGDEDSDQSGGGQGESSALGMSLRAVRPEEAKALGLKQPQGLLVVSVEDGSNASEAGIQRGDVILEINQHPIGSTDEARKIIAGEGKERGVVMLLLKRRGQNLFKALPVGKQPQ
jgi:serine protease Do